MRDKFTSRFNRRLKNNPLVMLARDAKNFVGYTVREFNGFDRKQITVKPAKASRGKVLLCYENKAFFAKPGEKVPADHTNRWESLQIAQTYLRLGYEVDVIGENNQNFVPAKNYSFFVGNRINFNRIAELINEDCVKILHIDTAHWLFHNTAQHQRLLSLQQRRKVTLPIRRSLNPNTAIECADFATILGNEFTISTYQYANKPLYRVPISAPVEYPWPENKDFDVSRRNFLWFGSAGFVHKGLDLVLEAFAEMPDYQLSVCGPIDHEREFKKAYYRELYSTSNIHTIGWVDIESRQFREITSRCIALIYPSCSEGQSGGVVTCLHAGLIPIISYESGVDVDGFGVVLRNCSTENIKNSVQLVSGFSSNELESRARKAWEYSRANHTRERFAEEYRKSISAILTRLGHQERPGEERTTLVSQQSTPFSGIGI
jgi:glycosyltransferase involved in cell wall biosynthesis